MPRSTKLVTAAYILSYVAAKAPAQITTDAIAKAVEDHPARVRQIVAALVKADLLTSVRGANGGVMLARPPAQINIRDVYKAVEDQPMLSLALGEQVTGWSGKCKVYPIFSRLYDDLEEKMLSELARYRLNQLYSK